MRHMWQKRSHFDILIGKLTGVQFTDNRDTIAFGHQGAGAGELSGFNPRWKFDTPVDKRLVQAMKKGLSLRV